MVKLTTFPIDSALNENGTVEDIKAAAKAFAATRTPEIEAVKQELLDTYGPALGSVAWDMIHFYKQGISLNELKDALNAEVDAMIKEYLNS